MAISFNNIPAGLRVPFFYAEIDNSQANTATEASQALVIGQKLAAGTAAANAPLLVSNVGQANALFGQGSMLARMVDAFRQNDAVTTLFALPLDDNGTAATGTITIGGVPTSPGILNIYIAGQRVQSTVTVVSTPATITADLEATINANADFPVTAAAAAGVLTLTARHAGELGNNISIIPNYRGTLGGEATPLGLTVTVADMATGTGAPALTAGLAGLADEPFDVLIMPYTDQTSLDGMGAFLSDTTGRWSPLERLYGHAIAARVGTVTQLNTFGGTRNDQHVSVMGYNGSPTPPWETAAMFGGQAIKSLSIDPARPLQTLPIAGFLLPPTADRFSVAERQTLLNSGISTIRYNVGTAQIERAITTYRVNAFGAADNSYLDLNTLATLQFLMRFLEGRITSKYARHKLVNDGTRFGAGQAVVTPNVLKAELVASYGELEARGLVENRALFKQNLIVERNATDPSRIDVVYPADLANALRIFAVLAQFRLQFSEQEAA